MAGRCALTHSPQLFNPGHKRISSLCLGVAEQVMTVVFAYAPSSRSKQPPFLESLGQALEGACTRNSIVLIEDFNTHVDNDSVTWRDVIVIDHLVVSRIM